MFHKIPTCDQSGCSGHLGKFDSCLAESLWEISLDGGDESTGDTEYEGHFTLLVFDTDDSHVLGDAALDAVKVTIPAGAYIIQSVSSGAVYLLTYDSESAARADYALVDAAYGEWLDADESDL